MKLVAQMTETFCNSSLKPLPVWEKNSARPGVVPVQDELRQKLFYNPKTGLFYSKGNVVFGRYGKQVGTVDEETGRMYIGFNYLKFSVVRLAYLYMEGYLPEEDPECIDGDVSNTSWSNIKPEVQSSVWHERNWQTRPWELKNLI